MVKSETRGIDGQTFTVQQLPAMRSLKLFYRLSKAVGPAVAKLMDGAELGKALADMQLAGFSDALELLFRGLSEAELEGITREVLADAQVNVEGKTVRLLPVLDAVLGGAPLTLLKVIAFALEVNYSEVFRGAGDLAGLWKASQSKSPTTSEQSGQASA